MNIQVINPGNCIICGKKIKIIAKRKNNKFPDIFFCSKCASKVKQQKREDKEEK